MGGQRKAAKDKDRGRQLRASAEKKLTRSQGGAPEDLAGKTAEKVLHELQVHQIELEMQNHCCPVKCFLVCCK